MSSGQQKSERDMRIPFLKPKIMFELCWMSVPYKKETHVMFASTSTKFRENIKKLTRSVESAVDGRWNIRNDFAPNFQIEVIPWVIADSNYLKSSSQKLDPSKTVFVGALHGQLTAKGLAIIMDDIFKGVIYAGMFFKLCQLFKLLILHHRKNSRRHRYRQI